MTPPRCLRTFWKSLIDTHFLSTTNTSTSLHRLLLPGDLALHHHSLTPSHFNLLMLTACFVVFFVLQLLSLTLVEDFF